MNPLALRLRTEDGELLPIPTPGKGLVFMKEGREVATVNISTKPGFPFQRSVISLQSNAPVRLFYFGKELISTKERPTGGVLKKPVPLTAEIVELAFPLSFLPPLAVKPYRFFGGRSWEFVSE